MKCKEAEFWISVRIDREEIPSGKGGALDRHLLECGACRGLLSRENERSALLGRSLSRPPGEEPLLAARILAQAPARPSGRASRSSWRGFWLPISVLAPLSAALLALAAGGGWWWVASTPEVPRPAAIEQEAGGYAVLEQNSLDTDVYSTEAGDPVGRDILRRRWVISPARPLPPGGAAAGARRRTVREPAGEVILDVERVDTRYFHFADFQYR